MLLQLQGSAVYGPVQSRRLGRSLGFNVLPPSVKVCTFNCLYCQYGWAKVCPRWIGERKRIGERNGWPSVQMLLGELEHALRELLEQPAYITFSGNGEPTLHPYFDELVDGLITLRDRYAPCARTAILSNSVTIAERDDRCMSMCGAGSRMPCQAGVYRAMVRDALGRLDVRIMKLDCGTDGVLHRYNQPCNRAGIDDIVAGLMKLDDICIQALLTGGEMGNTGSGEIAAWIGHITVIRPRHVQIYTLDRGCASARITALSPPRLREIGDLLKTVGIDAAVY